MKSLNITAKELRDKRSHLESRLLDTLADILSMQINEKITITLKDEKITLWRVLS